MLAVIVLPAWAGSGKQIKVEDADESAAVVSEVVPVDDRTVEPLPANEAGDYSIYGEVISGPFTEIPITAVQRDPLIDRTQETVYGVVNGPQKSHAARWLCQGRRPHRPGQQCPSGQRYSGRTMGSTGWCGAHCADAGTSTVECVP